MYNKAILVGRLTDKPMLKYTESGTAVTQFSVAVDRRYKDADGNRKADFINIVAWRSAAEFACKYFGKGDPIGIDGSIQTRRWEDSNGNRRTAVEVVADNLFFVGSKTERSADPQPANTAQDFEEMPEDTNDLPF